MSKQKPNMALKPTRFRYAPAVGLALRSPALRSGERGRGSGIRLSARRRANKRLEQTLRVVK